MGEYLLTTKVKPGTVGMLNGNPDPHPQFTQEMQALIRKLDPKYAKRNEDFTIEGDNGLNLNVLFQEDRVTLVFKNKDGSNRKLGTKACHINIGSEEAIVNAPMVEAAETIGIFASVSLNKSSFQKAVAVGLLDGSAEENGDFKFNQKTSKTAFPSRLDQHGRPIGITKLFF